MSLKLYTFLNLTNKFHLYNNLKDKIVKSYHTFQDDAIEDGDYEEPSNRRYNLEYDLIRDGVVELI